MQILHFRMLINIGMWSVNKFMWNIKILTFSQCNCAAKLYLNVLPK